MSKIKKIEGEIFGRLMVLEDVGWHSSKSGRHVTRLYKCLCTCGTEVVVRRDALIGGITRSCGCIRKETSGKRLKAFRASQVYEQNRKVENIGVLDIPYASTKHLQAYNKWKVMMRICVKSQTIAVCDEWLWFSNFKNWYDTMVVKYSDIKNIVLWKVRNYYSPETCFLVANDMFNFLKTRKTNSSGLPLGVFKCDNRYGSRITISNKTLFLGTFDNPQDAHNAYIIERGKQIKCLIDEYYQEGKITKPTYDTIIEEYVK